MGDLVKGEERVAMVRGVAEEEKFMEGMAVLDFDMLCSTVSLQAQGKWRNLDNNDDGKDEVPVGGEVGGVLRMWESQVFDCFDNRRIALESVCCPCYRFGKNMSRAGFGSCIIQGFVHFILALCAILNCVAFILTRRHCFLYLAVAFAISIGAYLGFFRTQIRKKFNIRGSESTLDDCAYHFICPCCALCQESRTLEMNNVQDGTWHGRGDTICIGSSYGEGRKSFFELHPPSDASTKSPEPCNMQKSTNGIRP